MASISISWPFTILCLKVHVVPFSYEDEQGKFSRPIMATNSNVRVRDVCEVVHSMG